MNTITPEQQKNRDELLAWLDAGAPETPCTAYPQPITGFCMSDFYAAGNCGTVCCMAGFLLRNTPEEDIHTPFDTAAGRLIGIEDAIDSKRLFIPSVSADAIFTKDTRWAAACMRKFFDTGIVDWKGTKP